MKKYQLSNPDVPTCFAAEIERVSATNPATDGLVVEAGGVQWLVSDELSARLPFAAGNMLLVGTDNNTIIDAMPSEEFERTWTLAPTPKA